MSFSKICEIPFSQDTSITNNGLKNLPCQSFPQVSLTIACSPPRRVEVVKTSNRTVRFKYKNILENLKKDLFSSPKERETVYDISKFIVIVLLILLHVAKFNSYFELLRMPTFFFVSGLFAYNAIRKCDIGVFIGNKIGRLIYLYIIWGFIILNIYNKPEGLENDFLSIILFYLHAFIDPPMTVWFLYALFYAYILARLTRQMNQLILLLLSFILSILSLWGHERPFYMSIGWLFFFFQAGLFSRNIIGHTIKRYYKLMPLFLGGYLCLMHLYINNPSVIFLKMITPIISIAGIASVIFLSEALSRIRIGGFLGFLGRHTLFPFVMHRPLMVLVHKIGKYTGFNLLNYDLAAVVFLLLASVFLGFLIMNSGTHLRLLFIPPWIKDEFISRKNRDCPS